MFQPGQLPAHVYAVGSVNGTYHLERRAGGGPPDAAGPRRATRAAEAERAGGRHRGPGSLGQTHAWPIFPHPKGKDFVDFDEDLQVQDL